MFNRPTLFQAAMTGDITTVLELLDTETDINQQPDFSKATPLIKPATQGH